MNISTVLSYASAVVKLYIAHAADISAFVKEIEVIFGSARDAALPRVSSMSVAEARKLVILLCLEFPVQWDTLPDSDIETICNGFGPDKWPESLRAVASWWYRNLQPVERGHDIDYNFSDGTRIGWKRADSRFARNAGKLLSYRYPISNVAEWPARAALWAKKALAVRLLALGGWPCYRAAYERRIAS